MKKWIAFALIALLAVGGAGMLGVSVAAAEEQPTVLGENELSLAIPEKYEQFLSMSREVNDVAVRGGNIAVADGKKIYLYDGEQYRTLQLTEDEVSSVEWSENGKLYFKYKTTGELYSVDPAEDELSAEDTGYNVNNAFTLHGNDVYSAYIDLNQLTISKQGSIYYRAEPKTQPTAVVMQYTDGALYYSANGNLYELRGETSPRYVEYTVPAQSVSDFAVYGGKMYYTENGMLSEYTLSESSARPLKKTDGEYYTALSLDGDYLYASVRTDTDTKIRRMKLPEQTFTDYEISTSSPSANRLSSAKASCFGGNTLIVADEGKLVLYGRDSVVAFPCANSARYVASDGNSILLADEWNNVYAYDFAGNMLVNGKWTSEYGTLKGLTATRNGNYYLITANNVFLRITVENGSFRIPTPNNKTFSGATMQSLCSDIYGNLYVRDSSDNLYRYTEEEFLSTLVPVPVMHLPSGGDIAVDVEGNVYVLSGNTLTATDGESVRRYTVEADGLLYNAPSDVLGFSFGYETNTVYFLFENYLLTTTALPLPCLADTEAGSAYDVIYSHADEGNVVPLVKIRQNALFIRFDERALTADSTKLPYLSYEYAPAERYAVVLGEQSMHGVDFYVVAIFNASNRKYLCALACKEDCTLQEAETYARPADLTDGVGYLTNDVNLYRYPYLSASLTTAQLQRDQVVSVLWKLSFADDLADYDYYYVCCAQANGDAIYGYVPIGFLRDVQAQEMPERAVSQRPYQLTEDVRLTGAGGKTLTLSANQTYALLIHGETEGVYRVSYTKDGTTYYGTVEAEKLIEPRSDGWRTLLVVVLLLLAAVILTNYLVWRPKNR